MATKFHQQHASLTLGAWDSRLDFDSVATITTNFRINGGVDFTHHGDPLLITLRNRVEPFFHVGSKLIIDRAHKITHQQIVHTTPQHGRAKAFVELLNVLPIENGGHNGSVRGGPTNPALLKLLDEARIAKAWRRRGEMLVGSHLEGIEHFPQRQCRQGALAVFVFFAVIETDVVDRQVAELFQHRARGTKRVGSRSSQLLPSRNVDGHTVKHRRRHLTGNETLPNQVVEARLLTRQHVFHLGWSAQR